MDHIFREFQGENVWKDGKNQVVKVFDEFTSKTSLFLMRRSPHLSDIIKLGDKGLRALSIEHNLKLRDAVMERLLQYAQDSISSVSRRVIASQIETRQIHKKRYLCII